MEVEEEKWLEWIDELSEQEYLIIDDFLDQETIDLISKFFNQKIEEDDFQKAGIGALDQFKVISEIRGDYTYWLERAKDSDLYVFYKLMDEFMSKLNRYCYLSLSSSEFHLAKYPIGSFYKKHLDQFKGRANRMITIILYLNPSWSEGDGGELKMYLSQGDKLIAPKWNRCVVFKSDKILHEVLPTNIERRSLTGWLLYLPPVLGQLLAKG